MLLTFQGHLGVLSIVIMSLSYFEETDKRYCLKLVKRGWRRTPWHMNNEEKLTGQMQRTWFSAVNRSVQTPRVQNAFGKKGYSKKAVPKYSPLSLPKPQYPLVTPNL